MRVQRLRYWVPFFAARREHDTEKIGRSIAPLDGNDIHPSDTRYTMEHSTSSSPPCLLDLGGALLQRIWEYLPVTDIGRAEGTCRFVRTHVTPFVWERIAVRHVPAEYEGGPSATLIGRERVRRWHTARRLCHLAERGAFDQPAVYEYDQLILPSVPYVPNVDTRTLSWSDYFVSMTRTRHGDRVTLWEGFVPVNLHAPVLGAEGQDTLVHLSLDRIVEFGKSDGLDTILQALRDPKVFSEFDDEARAARFALHRQASTVLEGTQVTILLVDRQGDCGILLSTQQRSDTSTVIDRRITRNGDQCNFVLSDFFGGSAVLQEEGTLGMSTCNLLCSVWLTTIRSDATTHDGEERDCRHSVSLGVRTHRRRWR